MLLIVDNDAKRPRDLPVAASLNLNYWTAGNVLLVAVRDLDARVAAEQPRAAHDWRGRQRKQGKCGDHSAQHTDSVTKRSLSRKSGQAALTHRCSPKVGDRDLSTGWHGPLKPMHRRELPSSLFT